jgi:hypothetical protein
VPYSTFTRFFFFCISAHFLNVLPSVCHLFYCSPCTSGGADETPAGLVFTLIRSPSRISILLFVYGILRVVLNMLLCLVIYMRSSAFAIGRVCLSWSNESRASGPYAANIGNVGWNVKRATCSPKKYICRRYQVWNNCPRCGT